MKAYALIALCLLLPALRAEEIKLPAKLPAYEAYIERKLSGGSEAVKEEGRIRVTVAYGDGDDVKKQVEMSIPVGSSIADAAAFWRNKNGGLLIGWAQGLVVVRRKTGDSIERVTWSQREARSKAPSYVMKDGDALIGLVYGDY